LPVFREIDVPLEGAMLRTGVYDPNSGKSGTMGIWLASGTN